MASADVVNPEALTENVITFNSAIRQSYTQAKKHLQDGITVIRDEFMGMYDKAESYFNIIALPVNNFLKDLTQIETELQRELSKDAPQLTPAMNKCNVIPIEQAMNGRMEENY
jgi:hypothetical protein